MNILSKSFFSVVLILYLFPGCLLLGGILLFSSGFEDAEVRKVCGPTARMFNVGECGLRWAFILAILGVLDAIVLSALAFVLATRHVKLQPQPEPIYGGSMYKGNFPKYFFKKIYRY